MKVHFLASGRRLSEDATFFEAIINILHDHDVTIVRNWIPAAKARSTSKDSELNDHDSNDTTDWQTVYNETLEAIDQSDAVIIEATAYNFMQGYNAFYAVQQQKPVLILLRDIAPSQHTVIGLRRKNVSLEEYSTHADLAGHIVPFIHKVALKHHTFHADLMLDNRTITLLTTAAQRDNQTIDTYLANLIRKSLSATK